MPDNIELTIDGKPVQLFSVGQLQRHLDPGDPLGVQPFQTIQVAFAQDANDQLFIGKRTRLRCRHGKQGRTLDCVGHEWNVARRGLTPIKPTATTASVDPTASTTGVDPASARRPTVQPATATSVVEPTPATPVVEPSGLGGCDAGTQGKSDHGCRPAFHALQKAATRNRTFVVFHLGLLTCFRRWRWRSASNESSICRRASRN